MAGALTLGDLALFYQAFNKGQTLMRSLLQNVGHMYSNSLFLGNLFEFLALKPKIVDPVQPVHFPSCLRNSIAFENVSFQYPGSERLALRNFSLKLAGGTHYGHRRRQRRGQEHAHQAALPVLRSRARTRLLRWDRCAEDATR